MNKLGRALVYSILTLKYKMSWMWWQVSVIPALGRQKQEDLCEFKYILVYIMNFVQLELHDWKTNKIGTFHASVRCL